MIKHFPKDPVFLALLLVFLWLPFAQVKVTFWGVPLYLPEIALLVALGCRVSSLRRGISWGKFFLGDVLATAGMTFFIIGAVSASLTHPFSLTGLGMLKSWFFFPGLAAWLMYSEAQNPIKRQWFFRFWFLTLVATALVNLLFVVFDNLTFDGRLSGFYPSPNFLAVFVAPAIPLAFFLAGFISDGEPWSRWKKGGLGVGGLIVLSCLFFTHSYGVWVALVVSVCFLFFGNMWLKGFQRKSLVFLLGVLLGVSLLVLLESGSTKWQALSSLDGRSSFSSRLMIWRAGWRIFIDQPLLGIGLGRFQEVYLRYQLYFPPYLEWAVPQPHNLFLAIVLQTGSFGLFGFLLLVGRFGYLLLKLLLSQESTNSQARLGALFFGSFLLLFFVYGLTDTPYFRNDLALTFFLFLGLGFSQRWHEKTLGEEGFSATVQSDRVVL